MRCRSLCNALVLALVVGCVRALPGNAQEPGRAMAVSLDSIQRLVGAGELAAARRELAGYQLAHPGDPSGALLAAQLRYWQGELPAADSAFLAALSAFPTHGQIRLEYARVLTQLVRSAAARGLLLPLLGDTAVEAEAATLLGTLDYWDGDYSRARGLFRRTLARAPEHAEARRQLAEIAYLAAPWARLELAVRRDDQPLRSTVVRLETGWSVTPLHSIAVSIAPRHFGGPRTDEGAADASVAYRAYWPGARLDTELAGGVRSRSFGRSADWTGRAQLGLRLPRGLRLQAAWERAAYELTLASVQTPVLSNTVRAVLSWQPASGWLGEAGIARAGFPDSNSVVTAYGWVLAPLLGSRSVRLRAGYGFGAQDSHASRWVPPDVLVPELGPGPVPGRYAPYYTPAGLTSHSAAAALAWQASGRVQFSLHGSYGFRASEDAPYLYRAVVDSQTVIERGAYARRFHPLEGQASVRVQAARNLAMEAVAGYAETAYWNAHELRVGAVYRFARRR